MTLALLVLLQAVAADPPPAPAPPAPVETLHKIVVDAIRNCPKGDPGEIVVCSKDRGLAEGFRIPKLDSRFARNLRPSGRGEAVSAELGAVGIGSCSKVGAGGAIGCARNEINAWAAEQRLKRQPDAAPKEKE